jgi:hypothetical protein
MHYHLEIIMPPTNNVEAAVSEILAPFDENAGDDEDRSSRLFWDFWQIGGRWGSRKMTDSLGQDRLDAFYKRLTDEHITVSSFTAGKHTLQPPEQAEAVNAMWNETFPEAPVKVFDNYTGDTGDVMRLADTVRSLTCSHVIIAAPDWQGKKLTAVYMVQDEMWNGVSFCKTTWDGTLGGALSDHAESTKGYKPEYLEKVTPLDDWLVVTVDYHS